MVNDGMRSRRTPTSTPLRVNACSARSAARVCYILLCRSCVFVRNNYNKESIQTNEKLRGKHECTFMARLHAYDDITKGSCRVLRKAEAVRKAVCGKKVEVKVVKVVP